MAENTRFGYELKELISVTQVQTTSNLATDSPTASNQLKMESENNSMPSFDCAKASIFTEKAICNDLLLGKLDGTLSKNYQNMLASEIDKEARTNLKNTQKKWISERNKCATNKCIADLYRKRIDEICDYPVISGLHPTCISANEIK